MTPKNLREPSVSISAITVAIASAGLSSLIETHIRPLPIFFDTDPQTWAEEKMGLAMAFSFASILLLRKLRTLFFTSERTVG